MEAIVIQSTQQAQGFSSFGLHMIRKGYSCFFLWLVLNLVIIVYPGHSIPWSVIVLSYFFFTYGVIFPLTFWIDYLILLKLSPNRAILSLTLHLVVSLFYLVVLYQGDLLLKMLFLSSFMGYWYVDYRLRVPFSEWIRERTDHWRRGGTRVITAIGMIVFGAIFLFTQPFFLVTIIVRDDVIKEVDSPDGKYRMTIAVNHGSRITAECVARVKVTSNDNPFLPSREIYLEEDECWPDGTWLNNHMVRIEGRSLNIFTDRANLTNGQDLERITERQ
ncbi:DUF5412 family protein [Laceyella putida]|uniref:DUF5412 family protein n=1 Tax=Laceyella putida TaxID=110101 RepID=A0ABW2RJ56_9BACL